MVLRIALDDYGLLLNWTISGSSVQPPVRPPSSADPNRHLYENNQIRICFFIYQLRKEFIVLRIPRRV